ncbi:MAG: hypothetical protein ACREGI_05985, partial [Candidatus Levyibacteriota bacterium]
MSNRKRVYFFFFSLLLFLFLSSLFIHTALAGPTPSFCKGALDAKGNCQVISTAIGDIPVDGASFIQGVFGFLLSVSGVIAVSLVIFAGYRLLLSQGNPEKTKGAQ